MPFCTQRMFAVKPSAAAATATRPLMAKCSRPCSAARRVSHEAPGAGATGKVLQPPRRSASAIATAAASAHHVVTGGRNRLSVLFRSGADGSRTSAAAHTLRAALSSLLLHKASPKCAAMSASCPMA